MNKKSRQARVAINAMQLFTNRDKGIEWQRLKEKESLAEIARLKIEEDLEIQRRLYVYISHMRSDDQVEPPIFAEFLVGLFSKKRYRNALLQNLEEDFETNLANGATVNRARRKYWAAALSSIGPQLFAMAKRIGVFGIFADWARRIFH